MKLVKLSKQSVKLFFQKPLIQVFAIAAVLNLLVDSFSRESLFRAFGAVFTSPLVFLYNTLIIAITLAPALFFTRRIFFYVIVALLWITVGITDFILLQFRTTPFTFVDITMIQSAIGIWDHYLSVWQLVLIALLILAAVIGCVILFRKVKKLPKLPALRVLKSIVLMLACAIIATDAGVWLNLLSKNFGNLADAYHKYGLPYCFANSLFNTGIDKPKKYSDEYVQQIIDAIENGTLVTSADAGPTPTPNAVLTPEATPTPQATVTPVPTLAPAPTEIVCERPKKPNILFLQLESFFDPTTIVGSVFTQDPLPNYRRLMEEYTSGSLYVPSVGAGTANTEFEVITGMNLDFFGPGEYPYKTILLETTCESIGYVLKNHGYGTHAIHNNDGTFYGRHLVFPNLGFDTFTSIEYMNNVARTPLNWAKDEVLIGEIAKALDSTEEPDFIYTISVQGHGSYPDKAVLTDPAIDLTLPEELAELYYPLLYYTNQIHEMDQFVADLIESLEKRGEDTVLVMYGDHLPGFKLTEEDLGGNSLFATQYIVWSSFDLAAEHPNLEAYQLYSYVLDRLGIRDGIINGFHQTQMDSDLYLEELEILEYDILYGDQTCYEGKNPYAPTDMQMGIDTIRLTGIRAFGTATGNIPAEGGTLPDIVLPPEDTGNAADRQSSPDDAAGNMPGGQPSSGNVTGNTPDGQGSSGNVTGNTPDGQGFSNDTAGDTDAPNGQDSSGNMAGNTPSGNTSSGNAAGNMPSGQPSSGSTAGNATTPTKQPSSSSASQSSAGEPTPEPEKEGGGGFWSIFGKKDKDEPLYTMFFLGSGFTPYSYVQVDGKELDTMFVSDTVLTAVMPLPDVGAEIAIVQHGPDEQILSSCEPLLVTEQLLKNIFPKENPELEGED